MAFSTHDIVPDSPTNNFATLNPLNAFEGTLSDGNLIVNQTGSAGKFFTSTLAVSKGKWYFEAKIKSWNVTNSRHNIGIIPVNTKNAYSADAIPNNIMYGFFLRKSTNNTTHSSSALESSGSVANDQIYQIAFDLDDNKFYVGKNGSWFNSSDPSNGTNSVETIPTGYTWCAVTGAADTSSNSAHNNHFEFDFGQLGFSYTPPTGFKALCTSNIQSSLAIDPAVDDLPEDYFKCVKYNGVSTGGGNFTVPVGFQSDLIWIKRRNNGNSHSLSDSVRGFDKWIIPDADVAERNNTSNNSGVSRISTVNSSGFTVHDNHNAEVNDGIAGSASQYISWNWKAGGGPTADYASSNDTTANGCFYKDGSAVTTSNAFSGSYTITPTRASIGTKQGFSIVKYTGNQTSGATFPHGLNKAPEFVIIKNLNDSVSSKWAVFHKDSIASGVIYLDDAAASASGDTNVFNSLNASTISTNNIITLGDYNGSNGSSDNHIMYAFTSIEGYSAFGSYTGNGSTDGPFIYTGFKPALVLIKCISDATTTHTSWAMYDNAREPHNVMNKPLYANQSAAEGERGNGTTDATDIEIDFLSNGFRILTDKEELNDDDETYIFCCWSEMPQKYAVAR